jgi:hypothetical protein
MSLKYLTIGTVVAPGSLFLTAWLGSPGYRSESVPML